METNNGKAVDWRNGIGAVCSARDGSESVLKMVTQIAAAGTEHSYSTQSVSASVGEIASIIERTAVSSEHSVESCQQFALLANELTCLAAAFKVSQA
jgi:methyl-accepting chemotaxis protein